MITRLLHLLRLLPFLCCGHRQLALENFALRQQLAVYKRMAKRPKLQRSDRLLWVWLSRVWPAWRQALVIVAPSTVLRWQRHRFRRHWAKLSGRSSAGRPPVDAAIKTLVRRMAAANPLWGAPRIHGELLKLGIDVAERTVSRLLPKRRSPPSQTWRTFLTNHVEDLVSIDFFTVPTAHLRVLFVLVVLAHDRRRVLHFNVTANPSAGWTAQQIVNAFPDDTAPSYLLRDRDSVYGDVFRRRVKAMQIREVLTAARSPWQNPFAERLIGSIRRECLNHVLVLGERHLHRILARYFSYYHRARTHLALDKDAPDGRAVDSPRRAGSCSFRKSAVCTTATSARRRNPALLGGSHHLERAPSRLSTEKPCLTVQGQQPPNATASAERAGRRLVRTGLRLWPDRRISDPLGRVGRGFGEGQHPRPNWMAILR
jgi:putative transposase